MKAVVTGATKGLGAAIVQIFLENGIDVIINSRSETDLLAQQAKYKIEFPDRTVLVKTTDMSVKEEVIAFGDFVSKSWGKVDILVNNAGVFLPGEIHKEEDGILEKQINTNLYSAYHLTRSLMPIFLDQASGHIINMCSIASKIAYPNGGSYSISKFALLGFSKVLREELKDKGIKVMSILPGATWSASWAGVDLPKERLMQARDIAIAVWSAIQMSDSAVIEEIVLRPQLGDL